MLNKSNLYIMLTIDPYLIYIIMIQIYSFSRFQSLRGSIRCNQENLMYDINNI